MTAALGGVCIEKHYTIDKRAPRRARPRDERRPDRARRDGRAPATGPPPCADEAAIGVRESELPARANARRSIVLERDVAPGPALTADDLGYKRPGTGIPPYEADAVVGATLRADRPRGTILDWDDLEQRA